MRLEWVFGLLFCLAACSGHAPEDRQRADGGQALEQAAIDSGLVVDPEHSPLTGLFIRPHSEGTDSLCITGPEEEPHFRLHTMTGAAHVCSGDGRIERTRQALVMRFDKAGGCSVVVRYDGTTFSLPGAVEQSCRALCTGRASLTGHEFDRYDSNIPPRGVPACA